MAGSLNKVSLIGNVGKDPEIRAMNNGNRVASFSMAMTESWKDKSSGDKKERTEWANVVVFNDGLVGVIDNYVSKGSKLYVEGQLQTRKYEKDGTERYITEVVLQNFGGQLILLSGKDDSRGGDDRSGSQGGGGSSGGSYERAGPKEDFPLDDEIPFASCGGIR
jgi:single-strand DNA-binding protein